MQLRTENEYKKLCLHIAATVSVFGLVGNGISLYVTRTKLCFRNAFGILCSSFLICNLQSIFILFYGVLLFCPCKKSPVLSTSESFWARFIGVLVNGPYYGSIILHLFVALNRLCAVIYPIKYKQLWTNARAFTAGIISWTLGMAICMAHLHKDYSLLFNQNSSYRFSYQDSYYGEICSIVDSVSSIFMLIATAFLDVITLIKILTYRKTIGRNTTISTSSTVKEREISFFKQSCLLGFIYISCVIMLTIHSFLFTNKWLLFASSTIAWILMQSVDGASKLQGGQQAEKDKNVCSQSTRFTSQQSKVNQSRGYVGRDTERRSSEGFKRKLKLVTQKVRRQQPNQQLPQEEICRQYVILKRVIEERIGRLEMY
ncbi:hypothetical protein DINM_000264 [Dirofilaria immitis]|nr:hypothetical protein [Dirofilaria immitis]